MRLGCDLGPILARFRLHFGSQDGPGWAPILTFQWACRLHVGMLKIIKKPCVFQCFLPFAGPRWDRISGPNQPNICVEVNIYPCFFLEAVLDNFFTIWGAILGAKELPREPLRRHFCAQEGRLFETPSLLFPLPGSNPLRDSPGTLPGASRDSPGTLPGPSWDSPGPFQGAILGRIRALNTYKYTYIHTDIHTNIQAYKPTNLQTYKPTNIQTYEHTNK